MKGEAGTGWRRVWMGGMGFCEKAEAARHRPVRSGV